jgi:hypothetical protein
MEEIKKTPCYWEFSQIHDQILVPMRRSVSFEMTSDCKTVAYLGDPHLEEKHHKGKTPYAAMQSEIIGSLDKIWLPRLEIFPSEPLCHCKDLEIITDRASMSTIVFVKQQCPSIRKVKLIATKVYWTHLRPNKVTTCNFLTQEKKCRETKCLCGNPKVPLLSIELGVSEIAYDLPAVPGELASRGKKIRLDSLYDFEISKTVDAKIVHNGKPVFINQAIKINECGIMYADAPLRCGIIHGAMVKYTHKVNKTLTWKIMYTGFKTVCKIGVTAVAKIR